MDPNELMATQGQPDGETAANPGNETAPELNNDEQHHDAGQGEGTEGGEGEGQTEAGTEEHQQPETPKPQQKKPLSWEMKRIHEETNKRREAEKRAADAEAELQRLRGGNTSSQSDPPADGTPPSIEEIRRQERENIRREESANSEMARRNAACNATFEKGVADIPDFDEARVSLVSAFGHEINTRPEFLDAITELENGHQVFAELGRNPAEAERILSLSPVKMALEIARMGDKLAKPAVPTPKPISKVPAPVTPIGGQTKPATALEDADADQDAWSAEYHKMMAAKLKR
ncbi:hypothetical protein ATY75_12200 [Rhizobium sp. N122]|uniref:hypothetical protein n=1 Tax=Rhizobium sp. N122 TaxID=1764272 RepID=UPI000B5A627A|nr:hypothetical protein [Rhizobium sp. N122]OWV62578.1 hypothetical protein ATY75_12200 [Rhizobium sp. N122]